MKVHINSKSSTHAKRLATTTGRIHAVLAALSRHYGFKLPNRVYVGMLRSCRIFKKGKLKELTFGTAEYQGGRYMIKFNSCIFEAETDVLMNDTIAEEVAHIAEALHRNRWSHSSMFRRMYDRAKTFLRDEIRRKC